MRSKLSITTEQPAKRAILTRPAKGWNLQRTSTHPGEVLAEDFLKPLHLSVNRLATALKVPTTRMQAIVKGHRSVSPDSALRLSRFFGTSPEFWLNLQQSHDLTKARQESGAAIDEDVRPLSLAS